MIEVLLDNAVTVVADPDVEISPSSSEDESSDPVGFGHSSMVINDEAVELWLVESSSSENAYSTFQCSMVRILISDDCGLCCL